MCVCVTQLDALTASPAAISLVGFLLAVTLDTVTSESNTGSGTRGPSCLKMHVLSLRVALEKTNNKKTENNNVLFDRA